MNSGNLPLDQSNLSRVNDDSAYGVSMAVDELGSRIDDDVSAVIYGPDYADANGVVDHQGNFGLVSDPGNPLEVWDVQLGVAYGLGVDGSRLLSDGLLELLGLGGVHENDLPAQLGEGVVEELVGSSVEVVG